MSDMIESYTPPVIRAIDCASSNLVCQSPLFERDLGDGGFYQEN